HRGRRGEGQGFRVGAGGHSVAAAGGEESLRFRDSRRRQEHPATRHERRSGAIGTLHGSESQAGRESPLHGDVLFLSVSHDGAELTSGAGRRLAGILMAVIPAWSCRGNADFSDAMPTPVTLAAEEYRREITEIDRLVFRQGQFDEARRTALAGELEGLARRMKAASDSRFIAIEVLEIRRLAE